jgi:hypothetical protein
VTRTYSVRVIAVWFWLWSWTCQFRIHEPLPTKLQCGKLTYATEWGFQTTQDCLEDLTAFFQTYPNNSPNIIVDTWNGRFLKGLNGGSLWGTMGYQWPHKPYDAICHMSFLVLFPSPYLMWFIDLTWFNHPFWGELGNWGYDDFEPLPCC